MSGSRCALTLRSFQFANTRTDRHIKCICYATYENATNNLQDFSMLSEWSSQISAETPVDLGACRADVSISIEKTQANKKELHNRSHDLTQKRGLQWSSRSLVLVWETILVKTSISFSQYSTLPWTWKHGNPISL